MDFIQIVLISAHIANVFSKRYASSSDESIENLLYYKDCQKKPKVPQEKPPEPMKLRATEPAPPQQFQCPYPKMCCSLSCNNECGNSQSIFGREDQSNQPQFPPIHPQPPVQPVMAQRVRKKKKPPIPPMGARRDFGFTKEKIKGLISKDEDIRKILKDLVRVTMQKVDLVEMMNSRRNAVNEVVNENDKKSELSNSYDDYDLE